MYVSEIFLLFLEEVEEVEEVKEEEEVEEVEEEVEMDDFKEVFLLVRRVVIVDVEFERFLLTESRATEAEVKDNNAVAANGVRLLFVRLPMAPKKAKSSNVLLLLDGTLIDSACGTGTEILLLALFFLLPLVIGNFLNLQENLFFKVLNLHDFGNLSKRALQDLNIEFLVRFCCHFSH